MRNRWTEHSAVLKCLCHVVCRLQWFGLHQRKVLNLQGARSALPNRGDSLLRRPLRPRQQNVSVASTALVRSRVHPVRACPLVTCAACPPCCRCKLCIPNKGSCSADYQCEEGHRRAWRRSSARGMRPPSPTPSFLLSNSLPHPRLIAGCGRHCGKDGKCCQALGDVCGDLWGGWSCCGSSEGQGALTCTEARCK